MAYSKKKSDRITKAVINVISYDEIGNEVHESFVATLRVLSQSQLMQLDSDYETAKDALISVTDVLAEDNVTPLPQNEAMKIILDDAAACTGIAAALGKSRNATAKANRKSN